MLTGQLTFRQLRQIMLVPFASAHVHTSLLTSINWSLNFKSHRVAKVCISLIVYTLSYLECIPVRTDALCSARFS